MAGVARDGPARRRDPVLITAFLQGKSIAAAAQVAGISERTAKRRVADPAFQRELAAARTRLLARAIGVLVDGALGAAVQLRQLAQGAVQESIRLAAARSILEFSFRGLEALDLAERVAALEQATEEGPTWRSA
jgi:hypothetical protein